MGVLLERERVHMGVLLQSMIVGDCWRTAILVKRTGSTKHLSPGDH